MLSEAFAIEEACPNAQRTQAETLTDPRGRSLNASASIADPHGTATPDFRDMICELFRGSLQGRRNALPKKAGPTDVGSTAPNNVPIRYLG